VSLAQGEPGESSDTQTWARIRTDGDVLVIAEHALEGEAQVLFVGCDFAEVIVEDVDGAERSQYDFVDCGLEPDEFDLSDARPDSVFRVQRDDGTAFELKGDGSVRSIEPFYDPEG